MARPYAPAQDGVATRYGALRTIAKTFKVLAWLTAAICILGIILSIAAAGEMSRQGYGQQAGGLGLVGILGYIIGGAIGFVSFYAAAESILVFLDIEENTRATRQLSRGMLDALSRLGGGPR